MSGEPFSGTIKGSLTALDLIIPWDGAQGRLNYTADIRGGEPAVQFSLAFDAAGPLLPLPGFAYAVTGFSLAGKYADGVLTVTSLGGKLGGGALTGSGDVGLSGGRIDRMDLRLQGKDMILSPMERMRAQVDASVRLLKDQRHFVTEGDVLFKRLTWRREIYEGFGLSSRGETGPTGPSFFDGMGLNIRLRTDENAVVDNALGRFDVRFNLGVTGSLAAPVLLGDIDLVSGDFFFQDRGFRVIFGRLSFTDPVRWADEPPQAGVQLLAAAPARGDPVPARAGRVLPPDLLFVFGGPQHGLEHGLPPDLPDHRPGQEADGRVLLPGSAADRSLYPGRRPGRHRRPHHGRQKGLPEPHFHLFDDPGQLHRHGRDRRGPDLPYGVGHQPEVLARGRARRPGDVHLRCQVPQALLEPAFGSAAPRPPWP